MSQRFYASPSNTFTWPNGAIGYRPPGAFDCLGPYAKVKNCPIDGTGLRLTCYATDYADTFFSIPACTRYRGKHIKGFFMCARENIAFYPYDQYRQFLPVLSDETQDQDQGGIKQLSRED